MFTLTFNGNMSGIHNRSGIHFTDEIELFKRWLYHRVDLIFIRPWQWKKAIYTTNDASCTQLEQLLVQQLTFPC